MDKELEIFKKKLIYRAGYRGTKEMDILMSGFVKKNINTFNLEQLKELVNSKRERNLCNLTLCFGLPAYWISPEMARELMNKCMPFQLEVNNMTRGIPEHTLTTLDGMLTNRYKEINAKITIPPLALALNDQKTSLTNSVSACNFQG